MRPEYRFLFACFGMSLVVTYAWWVRLRVWAFRQDLFAVRDRLWDEMRERGALHDPAYRDFRDSINSLIRLAPFLSILTVLRVLFSREEFGPLLAKSYGIERLSDVRHDVCVRVAKYILFESISGVTLLGVAGSFGMATALLGAITRRIEWLVDSKELQTLDANLSLKSKGRTA